MSDPNQFHNAQSALRKISNAEEYPLAKAAVNKSNWTVPHRPRNTSFGSDNGGQGESPWVLQNHSPSDLISARDAMYTISNSNPFASAKKAFERLSNPNSPLPPLPQNPAKNSSRDVSNPKEVVPERSQPYDYRSQTPYKPKKQRNDSKSDPFDNVPNTDDPDLQREVSERSVGTVPFNTPRKKQRSFWDQEKKEQEVLRLNAILLEAVRNRDWSTYCSLSDPALTSFEPASKGELFRGLDYRRFNSTPTETLQYGSMLEKHDVKKGYQMQHTQPQEIWENTIHLDVCMAGEEAAVVTCERLLQRGFDSVKVMETRVWQLKTQGWQQVHLHSSTHTGTAGEHVVE